MVARWPPIECKSNKRTVSLHNLSLYSRDIFLKKKFRFLDITTHSPARLTQFGTNGEIYCNINQLLGNRLVLPMIFPYNSITALSRLQLSLLHTPLDSPKRLSCQHKVDWPEKWACQYTKHARPVVDPRPQYESRRVGIYLVQDEHPAKLSLNIHVWIVTQNMRNDVTHMRVGIESEYPLLLQSRYSEESCTRRAVE